MIIPPVIGTTTFTSFKPLTDNVDIDFYTGKVVSLKNRSVEHILPKSKGGKNDIKNYAMSDRLVNNERGNMPLKEWLTIHPNYLQNMKNYVKMYWDLIIGKVKHGQEVYRTVKAISGIDLKG